MVADADWGAVDRAALRAELELVADAARDRALGRGRRDPLRVGTIPADELDVCDLRPWHDRGALTTSACSPERSRCTCTSQGRDRWPSRSAAFASGGDGHGIAVSRAVRRLRARRRGRVLLSTAGNPEFPEVFAVEATGHAAANSLWVSYAGPVGLHQPPAGIINPNGVWVARCVSGDHDAIVVTEIDNSAGERARTWRRCVRESRTRRVRLALTGRRAPSAAIPARGERQVPAEHFMTVALVIPRLPILSVRGSAIERKRRDKPAWRRR